MPTTVQPYNAQASAAEEMEVRSLLPILTPYTLPDGYAGNAYYSLAANRATDEGTNLTEQERLEAICYYIAHLISVKNGNAGITSERLGNSSVTRAQAKSTDLWNDQYLTLVAKSKRRGLRAELLESSGVVHEDAVTSDAINLDGWRPTV